MRVHSEESDKAVVCEECGARFSIPRHLTNHLKVDTYTLHFIVLWKMHVGSSLKCGTVVLASMPREWTNL